MLRRWWRKKPKRDFSKMETIVTEEAITLEHKSTGKTFSFSIGKDSNGQYWCLTDPSQRPKFCFEADDRDDAYQMGVDAINFFMESQLDDG